MYSKEIYQTGNGFSYKILKDDCPFIVQEIKPRVSGFQAMTEEEANQYADEELEYFNNLEPEE